jgi:hypothetical protein
MWIPTIFETKPTAIQPEQDPASQGIGLWVDGMRVSKAVERVRWNRDPIHLKMCGDCLGGDCLDGAWLSVRRAGSCVLLLPSFSRWLEGEWSEQGYEDPPAFLEKGAILLDRALYADLRRLVPDLPPKGGLLPLAGWEAVRLLRFEAPVEVLGSSSAPVQFRRSLLLGTHWWGSDDIAVKKLARSIHRDGEFFIITCSCGHAGCAGIRRGVDVFRDDGKVYWVIHRREATETLVFEEETYQRAIDTGLAEFGQLCARHPQLDPVPRTNRHVHQRLAELNESQRGP